jgi:hypothetical protein
VTISKFEEPISGVDNKIKEKGNRNKVNEKKEEKKKNKLGRSCAKLMLRLTS